MNVSESKDVRQAPPGAGRTGGAGGASRTGGVGHTGGEIERLKPEWLRIPEAMRIFGLGRSALYELIAGGKIQSVPLRKPGAKRGIRLIRYDSLVLYLERAAREGGVGR